MTHTFDFAIETTQVRIEVERNGYIYVQFKDGLREDIFIVNPPDSNDISDIVEKAMKEILQYLAVS